MFAVYVTALFCLMAVSQSASPACEDLVHPLDRVDRHHLQGRWNMAAGSLSEDEHLKIFKTKDSVSIIFANSSETSKLHLTRIFGVAGSCHYVHLNITLEGSSFIFDPMNVTFLHTSCPDCLVVRFDTKEKKLERLYLLSKRREVEPKEVEEFTAQVECLHMPPPVMRDPTKELCPDQSSTNSTELHEVKDSPEKLWHILSGHTD